MSDLILAVHINKDVRHIVDASREINIVALNALLTARQAGARSRGFSVVARELRQLAARLEVAMGKLDEVISRLATDLAQTMRDQRLIRSIELALAEPEAHSCLRDSLARATARQDSLETAVDARWTQLRRELHGARRLAEIGGPLARSAKIEAAYGGDMTPVLRQVAEQIESTMAQIIGLLGKIRGVIK
ncbi:MAG TPA: methyl-accepting chemotaxis protein [Rhodocyclaceae bacterium]|nr:methyl-accepting chemotaxis protein [Rhodocyclaceae bacterium]